MNRKSLMISTMLMSAVGVGVGGIGNVWAADYLVVCNSAKKRLVTEPLNFFLIIKKFT